MTAKEHYDRHLGNIYAWMCGQFNLKQDEQQQYFATRQVRPLGQGVAFDLGCGHGLQSVALANLGFRVLAVDFSKQLLTELSLRKESRPIEVIEADILEFLKSTNQQAEVIVCMGDTITHLPSVSDLENLAALAFMRLMPGGKLVLSFRDLSDELSGTDRFIPVRSDDRRILTCFLEYFDDHVMVHDILHEREGEDWVQRASAYPKLRLNETMVKGTLQDAGFTISGAEVVQRMVHLIAIKRD